MNDEIRTDEHFETDMRLHDRLAKEEHDRTAYGDDGTSPYALIAAEVNRAKRHGEKFASLHEAWAVCFEELDEIWDETRKKRRDRRVLDLRKEFIQLAAMAVKALESIENFTGGNV